MIIENQQCNLGLILEQQALRTMHSSLTLDVSSRRWPASRRRAPKAAAASHLSIRPPATCSSALAKSVGLPFALTCEEAPPPVMPSLPCVHAPFRSCTTITNQPAVHSDGTRPASSHAPRAGWTSWEGSRITRAPWSFRCPSQRPATSPYRGSSGTDLRPCGWSHSTGIARDRPGVLRPPWRRSSRREGSRSSTKQLGPTSRYHDVLLTHGRMPLRKKSARSIHCLVL